MIVTSFASHIHRLQEVIDAAVACERRVCVVGRSMTKNLNIARNLGYAERARRRAREGRRRWTSSTPDELVILCTGSQGEPLSALTRIAYDDHKTVHVAHRRHGDHERQAGAGQRARRARHDEPAVAAGRDRAAPGHRARARLRPRLGRRAEDGAGARPARRTSCRCTARCATWSRTRSWPRRWASRASGIFITENGACLELRGRRRHARRQRRGGRRVRRRPRHRRHRRRRAARPPPAVGRRRADHRLPAAPGRGPPRARGDRPRLRAGGRR